MVCLSKKKLVFYIVLFFGAAGITIAYCWVVFSGDGIDRATCDLVKVGMSSDAVGRLLGRESDEEFQLGKRTIFGGWSGTKTVRTWRGRHGYILVGFDENSLVTGAHFHPNDRPILPIEKIFRNSDNYISVPDDD